MLEVESRFRDIRDLLGPSSVKHQNPHLRWYEFGPELNFHGPGAGLFLKGLMQQNQSVS